MKRRRSLCIGGLLFCIAVQVQAQDTGGFRYSIETGVTVSGGEHTPFWLVANRYGLSSIRKNNGYLSAGLFWEPVKKKAFSYALGFEMAALSRYSSNYVVQQAYIDLRFRNFELSIGSKERGSEMKNDRFSTGGMTFSANARPVPQVRLGVPEYAPVPGTNGRLSFKGHVAYGMFTDDDFQRDFTAGRAKRTTNVLYHSKAGFLKFEHEKFPLFVEAGIEMAAQFGGKCYYPDGTVISSPGKPVDYLRVLFPMRGGKGASESDQINIYGNHLGSYSLAVGYHAETWSLKGYYEHFFDDGSGMFFKYGMWRDCHVGLEWILPGKVVETVVAEYLYTKHQSGAFHYFATPGVPESYTGADNYYNNSQYAGWEHWGNGMGNPLLISPVYNQNGSLSFQSNRVEAWHFGIGGNVIAGLKYRFLFTSARHWGTYGSIFPEIKASKNALIELDYSPRRFAGWTISLSGAFDGGDMIGKSSGGMLTVRKTGFIGKKKR